MRHSIKIILVLLILNIVVTAKNSNKEKVSFKSNVLPILVKKCSECHYDYPLDLTKEYAFESIEIGELANLENPKKSPLIITLKEEYHDEVIIKKSEIKFILDWIKQGCKDN